MASQNLGALVTREQVGKVEDVSDWIANAIVSKAPFMSMVRKDDQPSRERMECQLETLPRKGFKATHREDEKIKEFTHIRREICYAYMQIFKTGWSVGQIARAVEVHGLGRNEGGHQEMLHIDQLKLSMESAFLSSKEQSVESDSLGTAYGVRGAFTWLDETGDTNQTVDPVPVSFRLPTGVNYTGALDDYGVDDLKDQLQLSYQSIRGPVSLTMFTGIEFQGQMDKITTAYESDIATSQAVFSYNMPPQQYVEIIKNLKFSAGDVSLVPSSYLLCDEDDGSETSATHKSFIALDLDLWSMAWLQKPELGYVQYETGPVEGFISTICGLRPTNVLGQFYGNITTAT